MPQGLQQLTFPFGSMVLCRGATNILTWGQAWGRRRLLYPWWKQNQAGSGLSFHSCKFDVSMFGDILGLMGDMNVFSQSSYGHPVALWCPQAHHPSFVLSKCAVASSSGPASAPTSSTVTASSCRPIWLLLKGRVWGSPRRLSRFLSSRMAT